MSSRGIMGPESTAEPVRSSNEMRPRAHMSAASDASTVVAPASRARATSGDE